MDTKNTSTKETPAIKINGLGIDDPLRSVDLPSLASADPDTVPYKDYLEHSKALAERRQARTEAKQTKQEARERRVSATKRVAAIAAGALVLTGAIKTLVPPALEQLEYNPTQEQVDVMTGADNPGESAPVPATTPSTPVPQTGMPPELHS